MVLANLLLDSDYRIYFLSWVLNTSVQFLVRMKEVANTGLAGIRSGAGYLLTILVAAVGAWFFANIVWMEVLGS